MAEIALAGATAVLRQTLSVLSNLAVQEGSRLSRLKEEIVWIESEMRHMQAYLEDAEARQERSRGVANLVVDIRDLAHDVEDIMEKYFPRIASHKRRKGFWGCLKSSISHGSAARAFVMEIEGIKRRVENIKSARQTYGINEATSSGGRDKWDERRSFPHVDEPNVIGFEEHIDNLVAKMRHEELQCRVISIVGMAGLGKTTLAKKVYNLVRHRYERSAWICVSQQPNIKELLRDVARQVGLEKEKCEENIEANLFTLLSRHRYAIVIDDMWHTKTWDIIKKVIPTSSENGSRIILTSRNRDVGVHVGGWSSLHELQPLHQENSRNLFKMVMGLPQMMNETSDPHKLRIIGEKILKRCGGVPLAIVLAAGLLKLRERSENSWNGVLEGMGQAQDQCSEIFALSYKDLPTNLKPCFLYFGLFPEDHEISAFELINLWAAEGFIQGSVVREVEDVGDDYLNHLTARNLIQVVHRSFDGKVRSCRIHDILHNLCIREANEINFFSIQSDVVNIYSPAALRVRRVTAHRSDFGEYVSLNYPTPKLRAMMCFRGDLRSLRGKTVKNFVRELRFLRVLSVKCDCLSSSFLNEVVNLRHLSYLKLGGGSGAAFELPYTISYLENLLTLDVLEWGGGVILPDVIWNMKQLRHILLPRYDCDAPTFCGINLDRWFRHPITEISLPNLQTLHGLPGSFFEAEWLHKFTSLRELQINKPTKRIIEILSDAATPVSQKLEELWLSGGDFLTTKTLNLSRYENLRSLVLLEVFISELPEHDELPPNLTKFTLRCTGLQKDPMETLKRLPKLKFLILLHDTYRWKKMACSGEPAGNFPQLQVLVIHRPHSLEELIIDEGGMPRLRHLKISGCYPITRVPDRIRNIIVNE